MKKIKVWGSIMMMSIMMIDLAGHCFVMGGDIKREKKEREQQYRDIEPLVHYVGALIGGYAFVQDERWTLSVYDQSDHVNRFYGKKAEGQTAAGQGDADGQAYTLADREIVEQLDHTREERS